MTATLHDFTDLDVEFGLLRRGDSTLLLKEDTECGTISLSLLSCFHNHWKSKSKLKFK